MPDVFPSGHQPPSLDSSGAGDTITDGVVPIGTGLLSGGTSALREDDDMGERERERVGRYDMRRRRRRLIESHLLILRATRCRPWSRRFWLGHRHRPTTSLNPKYHKNGSIFCPPLVLLVYVHSLFLLIFWYFPPNNLPHAG